MSTYTAAQVAALYNKHSAIAQRVCDDAGLSYFVSARGAHPLVMEFTYREKNSYETVTDKMFPAHALTLFCAAAHDDNPGWLIDCVSGGTWRVGDSSSDIPIVSGPTRNAAILAALGESDAA